MNVKLITAALKDSVSNVELGTPVKAPPSFEN